MSHSSSVCSKKLELENGPYGTRNPRFLNLKLRSPTNIDHITAKSVKPSPKCRFEKRVVQPNYMLSLYLLQLLVQANQQAKLCLRLLCNIVSETLKTKNQRAKFITVKPEQAKPSVFSKDEGRIN